MEPARLSPIRLDRHRSGRSLASSCRRFERQSAAGLGSGGHDQSERSAPRLFLRLAAAASCLSPHPDWIWLGLDRAQECLEFWVWVCCTPHQPQTCACSLDHNWLGSRVSWDEFRVRVDDSLQLPSCSIIDNFGLDRYTSSVLDFSLTWVVWSISTNSFLPPSELSLSLS